MRVCDPAAGTGGFLLAAYERMKSASLDPDEKRFLRDEALRGWEIVDATARLCAMNLLLHGIGTPEGESLVTVDDALRSAPGEHFNMVLTNPPFGRKSSYKVISAEGETEREDMSYLREDFWATTSNKQLNFLQHVHSLLRINGRAAIVGPDNVLFEGGAGETIRRKLLSTFRQHRENTGVAYPAGQVGQELQGRNVRVLQVVDGEHHEVVFGQVHQDIQQPLEYARHDRADGLGLPRPGESTAF